MKKFVKDNKEYIIIAIVSIIAFIAGFLAVGPLLSFIIVGFADVLLFVPDIMKRYRVSASSNLKSEKVKTENKGTTIKKKKKTKKIFKILLIIFLICFILVVVLAAIFMIYIVINAPKFDPNKLYRQESTIIYDANGNEIASIGAENREKVTYDDLPQVLVDAIVATEDSRYFQHNGFDLPRFFKASVSQVLRGSGGGASTLTMQVAKNNFTSTKQTITRKFTDIYMSIFQIEKNYTKQEILEFYVNAPYLGSGTYGVEQACQTYFGKSVKDINLAEAALIAGLFQAPNAYDPNLYPESAESRRKTVLSLMERHGYITKEERKIAEKMTVDKLLYNGSGGTANQYQAFVDTVIEQVESDTGYDPYMTSMEIYTTLDTEKQKHIDSIMSGELFSWENDVVDAGIMVVDVKTGAIVAVGAGRNRNGERQYNTATMINRQIGSTSKPLYDYAPGIEYENWSTYNLYMDEPYSYSNGTNINNWDRGYNGLMTMRTALSQSRNIPALKAFQGNKNSNIKSFVTSLGLSPEINDGIIHEAHAIGGYNGESPLSMAAAYAAFGNGGYYIEPYSYTKIIYRETEEEVIPEHKKTQVMSEETAYMMTDLLKSSAQGGLGAQANIGGAVFGAKTGTSNYDSATIAKWGFGPNVVNDLWVNGVSPDYAISVWYGYKTIDPNYSSTAFSIQHRKLFQAVAKGVFKNGSDWTKPDGVVEVEVENQSWPAKLPSEYTPDDLRITELFKAGSEPTEVSDRFSKLENVTNLKGSVSGNTLKLTWTAISTPNAISNDAINAWAKSIASSESGINSLVGMRQSYNSSYIGNIVYKVYSKDSSGNLKLLKTTSDNSVSINVDSSSPTTYVVKTSYSIFERNMSDGVETKISLDSVKAVITSELKGEKNIKIQLGGKLNIPEPGVVVLEDMTDVTKKATINITVKGSNGETLNSISEIDTSKVGVYTITYNVSYKDYADSFIRTVAITS